MEKKWHAIYTRQSCERKVSMLLSKRKISYYLPLNRVSQLYTLESKKYILEPLFQNMLFVQIDESEHQQVIRNEDVVNFYYWLGRIAIIDEQEIKDIQFFVAAYSNITIRKIPIQLKRLYGEDIQLNLPKDFRIEKNFMKTELHSIGYALEAEFKGLDENTNNAESPIERFAEIAQ